MKEMGTEEIQLTQFEKDELMFEDAGFLNQYFNSMRDKIAEDIENVEQYFPKHAGFYDSKLYKSPHSAEKYK